MRIMHPSCLTCERTDEKDRETGTDGMLNTPAPFVQ